MELVFDDGLFVGAFTSRMELLRAMVWRLNLDDDYDLVLRFFGTNACVDSWLLNDEAIDAIDEHNNSYGADDIDLVTPIIDSFWDYRTEIDFLMGENDLHVARLVPNFFASHGFYKTPTTIKQCYDGPRLDDDDMNFVYMGLLRRDLNDRLRFLAFVPIKQPIEGNVIYRVWRMLV